MTTPTIATPAQSLRDEAARITRLAEDAETLANDLRAQATEVERRAQTLHAIAATYRASAAVLDDQPAAVRAAQE